MTKRRRLVGSGLGRTHRTALGRAQGVVRGVSMCLERGSCGVRAFREASLLSIRQAQRRRLWVAVCRCCCLPVFPLCRQHNVVCLKVSEGNTVEHRLNKQPAVHRINMSSCMQSATGSEMTFYSVLPSFPFRKKKHRHIGRHLLHPLPLKGSRVGRGR